MIVPLSTVIIAIVFCFHAVAASSEDSWSFLVLADWHGAEEFVSSPGNNTEVFREKLGMFQYIHQTYGGDLVIAPGDSNSGRWYRQSFIESFNSSMSPAEAILAAGKNCYGTMKQLFVEAGYDKLLMAVGDHELGGNGWGKDHNKTLHLPQFRETFAKGFNRDPVTDEFLYSRPIGNATATPVRTTFQYTSYAHQHKNVLFLTVDAFTTVETDEDEFFDRENGRGGEGIVTCTVTGDHLAWFRHVLQEAKKEPSIQHIFVQAHVPVLQPVRKITSSGQYMDDESDSEFWKAMVEYGVDVYFAGDVHADSVTKDSNSNLLQVISRGNKANNFLTVKVSNDSITIDAYNEIGPLPIGSNHNHTLHGNLVVSKLENIAINSTGSLKLLNRDKPIIHFDFEEIIPLESRPIIGMKHDYHAETLVSKEVTMRGIVCSKSLPNRGIFGQQYDAQVANVNLVPGSLGSYVGQFNSDSRVGIYSRGPFSGGEIISFTIWIKTTYSASEMVVFHYGRSYSPKGNKDILTLTLNNGTPNVYTTSKKKYNTKLTPSEDLDLADGQWHHLAVIMKEKSCKLSELVITVDGMQVETEVSGEDENLFFFTNGHINLGYFGYSHSRYDDLFNGTVPFTGFMDDFYVWSRSLQSDEIQSFLNVPSSPPSILGTGSLGLSNAPSHSPSLSLSPTSLHPSSLPTVSREMDEHVCEEDPLDEFVKKLLHYQGHKGNVKEARTQTCKWLAWIARDSNNPELASELCKSDLKHGEIGSAAEVCKVTCQTCSRARNILRP